MARTRPRSRSSSTARTPTIKVRTPHDILAVAPLLLGFHPRRSVVGVEAHLLGVFIDQRGVRHREELRQVRFVGTGGGEEGESE